MHWRVGTAAHTTSSHHHTASRSDSLAVDTHTRSRFPSVSTTMWRLRPLTFFPPIVAMIAADFRRLDRLAIDDPGGRLRITSGFPPHRPPQGVIHPFPRAVLLPFVEVV